MNIKHTILKKIAESTLNGQDLMEQPTQIIKVNLHNEQFGVSELACEMGLSR